jgi:hypothetical protein
LGPAYRVVLSPSIDWDLAARAAAFSFQAPGSHALASVPDQQGSWTAVVTVCQRLELRLNRQLRASLGVEAGALLRSVSYSGEQGDERLRGLWVGGSLGVIVTPP